jgi:TonB-linked SusC/RagA family outer membrane protein
MNRNIIYKSIICLWLSCMLAPMSVSVAQTADSSLVDLGMGIAQTKELSTASTYMVSGEELQKTAAINLQDALYGKLLGLTALKNPGFSGNGGYGGNFTIRGTQTTTENDVLILVDGLERPIDRMSVDEVEHVMVLKDAAAVALYGYRGINGAILVKTKRSLQDELTVSARYDHKIQSRPDLSEFASAFNYAKALNEARSLDGLSPAYNQYELNAFENNTYPLVYPNVDWEKEALKDKATENQATLNISGGNENVKYLALLNYVDASGLLKGTESNDGYSTQLKYSKANIRTNLDIKLTNTTKMQVNIMGSFNETNRPTGVQANDVFSSIYNTPASAYPVLMTDGRTWGGTSAYGDNNLVANIEATGHYKIHERALFADGKLIQDLDKVLKGLSASIRLGYDNRTSNTEQWERSFEYGSSSYIFDESGNVIDTTNFMGGSKSDVSEFGYWIDDQWRSSNVQFELDYVHKAGNHNIGSSLIYTTNTTVITGQYNKFNRADLSLSGHYDYDNRYLVDFVLMGSGSNRSWPEKYAFSPTVSAGWVLSNESFLKDNSWIDLFKLRASAGILHSDYVPEVGLSLEHYGGSAGWFTFGQGYNESWGTFLSYFPTKDFALERAQKVNIGLDLRFWNSLDMTLEGYYQRRDNILQSADELNSLVVGIPSSYLNKGVVDSKGIELGLNFQKNIGDLTISSGFLATYGTNEIIDMVEAPQAYPYLSRVGLPVDQSFGLEAIGFFSDEADIASSPVQEFDNVKPGDVKYKDVNKDGVINENDEVAMGYAGAPEINYAFNLGLEFKGIGVNFLFQGASNYTQYLGTQGVFTPLVNNSNLTTHYLENAWHPDENNSNAIYPRLTSLESRNNYRASSIWYRDASFLKLRHCEGGYPILPAFNVGASIVF